MSSYTEFKVDLSNANSSWTIIYDLIRDNSSVLDIGCSSGYFDKILIENKKCVVDGIEIDAEDAERAKKICRSVIVGNIEDSGFPLNSIEEKYDYILFIDVLEHLVNPSTALMRVKSLLKDNGKIIFSIPNMANGSIRLQLLQGNFDYEKEGLLDATHLHYYTGKSIQDYIIKDSGLKLVAVEYTTSDTPRQIIDQCLKMVGLNNTDNFTEFINSEDSLVYQYIGTLQASGKSINISKPRGIKPKLYYEDQLKSVQNDARKVFANYGKLNKRIASLELRLEATVNENQNLQVQIESLKKNNPFKRLKNRIVGKFSS